MAIIFADEINYEELIKKGFVLVDFYGEFCGPCKQLDPVLEKLVFEAPFVSVVKVNGTDCPKLSVKNKIKGVPTLLFLKDGVELERRLGYRELDEVKELVGKYLY